MTSSLIVTVVIKGAYGRFETRHFRDGIDFPGRVLNRGTTGEKGCSPVESSSPPKGGDRGPGNPAPRLPALVRDQPGFPGPPLSVGGDELGDVRNSVEQALDDVAEARMALRDKAAELAQIDADLGAARTERTRIMAEIEGTHRRTSDGLILLDLGRAPLRKPLWDALMAHTLRYGPAFSRRARLNSEVKELERHVEHLKRRHDRERNGKRRSHHA